MLEIDDATKCGIGEGANCCAFLTGTPVQFLCGRTDVVVYTAITLRLDEGTMNAKYNPGVEIPYPECQTERPSERRK